MSMIIEQNIMVPMRDGVRIATDVYRPDREGQWPVLVMRHPYNKDFRFPIPGWENRRIGVEVNLNAERVVEAGYVIVAQDVRGRYASEGEFMPFLFERSDVDQCLRVFQCAIRLNIVAHPHSLVFIRVAHI